LHALHIATATKLSRIFLSRSWRSGFSQILKQFWNDRRRSSIRNRVSASKGHRNCATSPPHNAFVVNYQPPDVAAMVPFDAPGTPASSRQLHRLRSLGADDVSKAKMITVIWPMMGSSRRLSIRRDNESKMTDAASRAARPQIHRPDHVPVVQMAPARPCGGAPSDLGMKFEAAFLTPLVSSRLPQKTMCVWAADAGRMCAPTVRAGAICTTGHTGRALCDLRACRAGRRVGHLLSLSRRILETAELPSWAISRDHFCLGDVIGPRIVSGESWRLLAWVPGSVEGEHRRHVRS
jgi:hypothetical protein